MGKQAERPIHESQPEPGYYRMRPRKGQPYQPVAIWFQGDDLVCRVGADMRSAEEVWLYCAGNRVAKADAMYAFEHGKWQTDAPEPIGAGHNEPPSDDPFDDLTREIEAEEKRVQAWVAEQHDGASKAEMAANWLAQLRKLESRTVAAFDAEKAPVLAETKRIDGKWRDLKARAAAIKKAMDDCFQGIGRREKARQQAAAEARARAEAEARRKEHEAEQVRLAEMAAAQNMPVELAPPPVVEIAPVEPVKLAFGGATGAKIAVRAVPPRPVIEDWSVCASYYSNHTRVREVLQKLVAHDVRDGRMEIPGVKIIPGEQ